MAPVLEQLAVRDHAGEQVAAVGPEAGEERELLRTHDDVHRVDLDEPDASEHPPDVTTVHPTDRTGNAEPLRAQRNATSARRRQLDLDWRHQLPAALMSVIQAGG